MTVVVNAEELDRPSFGREEYLDVVFGRWIFRNGCYLVATVHPLGAQLLKAFKLRIISRVSPDVRLQLT